MSAKHHPDFLSVGKPAKTLKGRREPSGVFSLFQPGQIQQFKEAFQLIDHDKDGWVSEGDLKEIFSSLGIVPTRRMLDELLSARPGGQTGGGEGINFTMFLTMMSERLSEFDGESELVEAFSSFDEEDTGSVSVDELRQWLESTGERMESGEVARFVRGDKRGKFNYRDWVKVLRVNDA